MEGIGRLWRAPLLGLTDQSWVGILSAGVHHGDLHGRMVSLVPARRSPAMYWAGYTNGEIEEGSTGGYFNRPLSLGMVRGALEMLGFREGKSECSWGQLPGSPVATCPFGEDALAAIREGEEVVYFVRAGDGPVKIGTTTSLAQRLGQMQTAHSTELHVLGIMTGGKTLERKFHAACASNHVRGEWFEAWGNVARLVLEATHVVL